MDTVGFVDEKSESRLYIGNLDLRINEAALIKMFSPYGKIKSEDFLWHTRGPKKGEPRGYAFIHYSSKEEAELAKEKMHGRLACGRPLVVRLASEKLLEDSSHDHSKRSLPEANRTRFVTGSSSGQMSRNEKVAAIKNKLKALEDDEKRDPKKQKR
ncbi:Polyadenylate-binding protein 5 [Cardamine amara subsp. amara]|uniref:Probable RNA-binding protein 18 n=1 Tax=Cardamine amara subsp. amara TaxID=228776 RepID=A0ABD1AIY8_CARAN